MTKSSNINYRRIDIHKVLEQRRQVAVVWCIEDVQSVRPDLNDDQAWEVLAECQVQHDCEFGFTWLLIANVADEMFPRPEDAEVKE